jgi:uncharacterized OB-fold protein
MVLGTLVVFLTARAVAAVREKTWSWRTRVEELDYEACLKCGYALKGLPARHRCPECGRKYDLYKVKLQWTRRIRKFERDLSW